MNPPCRGRNLPSVMASDGETDDGMCGDIMKPENRTQRNPYLGTKPQKWEKLLMNDHTKKGTTPASAIVVMLKSESGNYMNKMLDSGGRILFSFETCTPISPEH
jgi:hypothetical protein